MTTLAGQLRTLGLTTGDNVLVRAALKALGDIPNRADALIDALREVIGSDGTILGLAFSRLEMPGCRNKADTFDPATDPITTGGFAQALAARPGAIRSTHPTNSFVALGPAAAEMMAAHTESSACFAPMRDLIARNGKMLLVGCTQTSPGFSTVHLAQCDLGLSRSVFGWIIGRYVSHDGRTKWFRRRDNPGCSQGFGKFYDLYRKAGVLQEGMVGAAPSMLIAAGDAYAIEHAKLRADKYFALCDQDTCWDDRLAWLWKWPEPIRFLKGRLRRG